eukprot:gene21049-23103_t
MREECTRKLLTLNIRLGGPGRIVEIDESVMIKGKYNRGARRQQHQQWVFGIYDRKTKVGYLQFVDHRDEATLFPNIQQKAEFVSHSTGLPITTHVLSERENLAILENVIEMVVRSTLDGCK